MSELRTGTVLAQKRKIPRQIGTKAITLALCTEFKGWFLEGPRAQDVAHLIVSALRDQPAKQPGGTGVAGRARARGPL